VAVADAGSFTHAAEQIFIAQPTLSQKIRRLEQIMGTPLLHRRREGLRLTTAGGVLLDASRNVLSLVDHEVSRARQAAGLGRLRLRIVRRSRLADTSGMVKVSLRNHPLTASAALIWSGDLPRKPPLAQTPVIPFHFPVRSTCYDPANRLRPGPVRSSHLHGRRT
jgi:DNA-binding transcriptional LysR family regulator